MVASRLAVIARAEGMPACLADRAELGERERAQINPADPPRPRLSLPAVNGRSLSAQF
jgi:hypothetical protein